MDPTERRIIDDLFGKLNEAERQGGPRDAEAESHIADRMRAQPAAPYYMAQAIVVQEQALEAAQARIAELERQLASRPAGGGFLSGLFGGGRPAEPHRPAAVPPASQGGYRGGPWGGQPGHGHGFGRSGGGFMGGALQTAMAVAGGVVVGSMIADLVAPDAAEAAEPDMAPGEEEVQEPGYEGEESSDFGGDFGDEI